VTNEKSRPRYSRAAAVVTIFMLEAGMSGREGFLASANFGPGKKKMIRVNAGIAIALFIPVPDQEALHAPASLP